MHAVVVYYIQKYHDKQYKNKKISIDEYIKRTNYTYFYSEYFVKYSLCTLSVYLLVTNFIFVGLTDINLELSVYLTLGILVDIFIFHFLKGLEIGAEMRTKNLLEEDPKHKVKKEMDLLGKLDPRRILMPLFILLVNLCFKEVDKELSERDTDMSDVNIQSNQQTNLISATC